LLDGSLNFKEYLVVLAVSSVLRASPFVKDDSSSTETEAKDPAVPAAPTSNTENQTGAVSELNSAMQFVFEAWVLFDKDASGVIGKGEVLNLIGAEKNVHASPNNPPKMSTPKDRFPPNHILSKQRWEELGGAEGLITFREFVGAMVSWVGADEEFEES